MSEQTEILPMERVSEGECKNYVKYDQMAEKDEKEQKKKKNNDQVNIRVFPLTTQKNVTFTPLPRK